METMAQTQFKASIEAKLNAASSSKKTISELTRAFVHSLVQHDKKIIQMNHLAQTKNKQNL